MAAAFFQIALFSNAQIFGSFKEILIHVNEAVRGYNIKQKFKPFPTFTYHIFPANYIT